MAPSQAGKVQRVRHSQALVVSNVPAMVPSLPDKDQHVRRNQVLVVNKVVRANSRAAAQASPAVLEPQDSIAVVIPASKTVEAISNAVLKPNALARARNARKNWPLRQPCPKFAPSMSR